MTFRPTEYGRRGVLGVGTPQANPTVEAELGLLRPAGVSLVTARMYSDSKSARTRLTDYLDDLGSTLTRFDDLALSGFGFACTGSAYIRGRTATEVKLDELSQRFGYPVIATTTAIERVLSAWSTKKLLVVAPYPDWLMEVGQQYWQGLGLETRLVRIADLSSNDTHRIYTLDSSDASAALDATDVGPDETVLISGTGLPSLRAVIRARAEGMRALSSNLALAWALRQCVDDDGASPDAIFDSIDEHALNTL